MYLRFLNFASSFGTCCKNSEIKSDRPIISQQAIAIFPKEADRL
ncbi:MULTISPECIES: hypothetical protein [Nostocaceae]|nr:MULTISPECIES: hypothetical protein [Nostocaceae]